MRTFSALLLSAMPALRVVVAVYLPISDTRESYPLLRDTAGTVLEWSSGEIANLRLAAAAVHVSDRGVRTVPVGLLVDPALGNWHAGDVCHGRPGSLCRTPTGSTLFPQLAADARIPEQAAAIADDEFTYELATTACTRYAARSIANTTAYAVTLCDITQKNYEFLLVDDFVFYHEKSRGLWFYLLVSIPTIILVTSVSQNIAILLGEHTISSNRYLEFAAVALLVAISWYDTTFYTVGDTLYYYYTIVYIIANTVYWITKYTVLSDDDSVPINVLLGTVLLTLCSLYHGIESEYIAPVLFLLLTRCFYKAIIVFHTPPHVADHAPQSQKPDVRTATTLVAGEHDLLFLATQITIMLDFALAALTHQYGLRPLFHQAHVADLFFAVMTVFAYSLATFLLAGI